MVRAYLREEIDVVQLTTVDIIDICSRQQDRCPVVVLVLNESLGGGQIMTLRLNHLRDLSDRKIGVATSGFGPFVLEKALQSVDRIAHQVRTEQTKADAIKGHWLVCNGLWSGRFRDTAEGGQEPWGRQSPQGSLVRDAAVRRRASPACKAEHSEDWRQQQQQAQMSSPKAEQVVSS